MEFEWNKDKARANFVSMGYLLMRPGQSLMTRYTLIFTILTTLTMRSDISLSANHNKVVYCLCPILNAGIRFV
jgi:hypothetical protein